MTSLTKKKIFISYNHGDKKFATKLSLELIASKEIDVFIDHWEMGVGDSLLDNIETGIDDSSFLIVLLSPSSVDSSWVRTELQYAYYKEKELGITFILPVILSDCKMPIHVVGRIYIDFRNFAEYANSLQQLISKIQGDLPFSMHIRNIVGNPTYKTLYDDKSFNEGKKMLIELAQYSELDVEEHQKWLLWESFHFITREYKCTMKIGRNNYSNFPDADKIFILIDRWNETINNIPLTKEDFEKGLWYGQMNVMESNNIYLSNLTYLGNSGRLIFRKTKHPNHLINPFLDTVGVTMKPILDDMKQKLSLFSQGGQESFLFDFQKIVFSKTGRKIEFVVGKTSEDLCLSFSSMIATKCSKADNNWAVFELYDTFFKTLKYTHICPNHQEYLMEGDINFMNNKGETILGLS